MGRMARYNIAARSLRHLRFARRMLVSQSLLARVTQITHPPIAISFDGYQFPIGRILRRLPQSETMWLAESEDSEADAAPAADVASPAETLLRLLPRLPETHAADTASAPPGNEVDAQPRTTSSSTQLRPRRVADDAPPATTTTAPGLSPVRADAPRPRSRIVELPGIVSLPAQERSSDEPGATDMPDESSEDAPVNTYTPSMEEAQGAAEGEPEQPPLMRISIKGEEPATVGQDAIPRAAAGEAPPVAPVPAPRRRGKQTAVTPPRASDALFPPTDADRSPAAWLARLQHANEPTSPARPAPPATPVKSGTEPPTSTPVQRPGARGSRKGAARAQASTTSAPHEHTSSTTTASPEQSQQSQQSQSEEQPAQLPDSSRTLLHTLTGVDPASVRVYRGPVAARATSAQHADALTDGGAIALGGGHATDTPETLGLLAHELTHIAQRRTPRFVPPVTQTPLSQHKNYAGTAATLQGDAGDAQPAASPADEEAQAQQIEARVTRVARAKATPPPAIQPALPVESAPATLPARQMPSRPETRPIWGNLPAPWEPLPEWMTTPAESSASAPQAAPQPAPQPQPSSSAPARAPSADTPGTQRAERGRSLPSDVEEPSPAHVQETVAPEPDLDLLAQQVHAILKRRLAAERRRFG